MVENFKSIKFTNCRLLRDHSIIKEDLLVRNGKIINPEPVFFDEKRIPENLIDCKNAIIAPGFIDLQINGGYGVDFSYDINTVEEGIIKVARGLIINGVTSFCPTIVSSPSEVYRKVLPKIPTHVPKGAAGILGIHLEGPFISPQKKGAHPEICLKKLEKNYETLISTYGTLDNVKIVTLAPENDLSGEVTQKLTSMGITVSVGHSIASLSEGENCVQNGATLITHLFNAMLPFHHRDPGLVGLLTSTNLPANLTMYFGIIADGVHTHPAALRIAHRTHPNGLILVTDAISALGLEDGVHHIGQLDLEVRNRKAFIAGTNTLCGSIAPMDESIRIFKNSTECSIVYALETATLHPAKCLGIEKSKGTLDFDSDADFVILDDQLHVLSTWIGGECVYKA